MVRHQVKVGCDQAHFFQLVKAGFRQRRKMLRNALAPLGLPLHLLPDKLLNQRAEALGVADFVGLAQSLEAAGWPIPT